MDAKITTGEDAKQVASYKPLMTVLMAYVHVIGALKEYHTQERTAHHHAALGIALIVQTRS